VGMRVYTFVCTCMHVRVSTILPNCRLYYSQVTVDPQKSIDYVQRNRNKKVIYRSFVTNSYTNIAPSGSFNALVNSGIIHPTGVLICPFIAATTGANGGFGDFQFNGVQTLIRVTVTNRYKTPKDI